MQPDQIAVTITRQGTQVTARTSGRLDAPGAAPARTTAPPPTGRSPAPGR